MRDFSHTNADGPEFSVVTGRAVYRVIHGDPQGAVSVVREAYLAHARGRSVNPPSVFLRFPDRPNARIIGLPAYLGGPWNISGIKWIASYPDNTQVGMPRASAVLILNNEETGYPFACLEASIISAARTAASATLAADHLTEGKRRANTVTIVGTGFISRYIYQFLTGTGWQIENVVLYDLVAREAERFAAQVCDANLHSSVRVAPDLASALRAGDLIIFATVATKPHISDASLFEHCPTVLHISLRDLSPDLLLGASNVVDDIDHVMQADTSAHLAEKLSGSRSFVVGTLADVIERKCTVDRTRSVIFSPFGLGLLDLAVGKWVYDRVEATERRTVGDFFYDLAR